MSKTLIEAVKTGEVENVSQYILDLKNKKNLAELNAKNEKGDTPLSVAAEYGELEIFNLLTKEGAKIYNGDSPLVWLWIGDYPLDPASDDDNIMSSMQTINFEIVKQRIQAGGNLNTTTPNCLGQTLLFFAAYWGDPKTANLLIEAGANVNILDENSESALFIAARNSDSNMIKLLLDAGAVANLKSKVDHKHALKQSVLNCSKKGSRTYKMLANALQLLKLAEQKTSSENNKIFNEVLVKQIKLNGR